MAPVAGSAQLPLAARLAHDGPVAEGSVAHLTLAEEADPAQADLAAGLHYAFACDGSALDDASYATSSPDPRQECHVDDGPASTGTT